jgi:uncharacterized damage-inducible protein DinB
MYGLTMRVYIPISAGDLIDRITILQIKMERIPNAPVVDSISDELDHLVAIRNCFAKLSSDEIREKERELRVANETLWEVENTLRALEERQDFGANFVAAARRVYLGNDERAALKRQINQLSGSALREEKWFSRD